jgi:hypothetical protein
MSGNLYGLGHALTLPWVTPPTLVPEAGAVRHHKMLGHGSFQNHISLTVRDQ